MAFFSDMTITEVGLELIRDLIINGGERLVFSGVAVGDGVLGDGDEAVGMVTLKREVKRLAIESFAYEGGKVSLGCRLASDSIECGFAHRELGIFATRLGTDVLVAYGNAGNYYDYMPSLGGASVLYKDICAEFVIGSGSAVFIELPNGDFLTHAGFASRIAVILPEMVGERFEIERDGIAKLAVEQALAGSRVEVDRARGEADRADGEADRARDEADRAQACADAIEPPRLNFDGNHFWFNYFVDPDVPDDRCVYPYGYLKRMIGGKDNYQLWIEAGNVGSLEDFLESLKGESGDGALVEALSKRVDSKVGAVLLSTEEFSVLESKDSCMFYLVR